VQAPSRPPETPQLELVRELWTGPLGSVWFGRQPNGSDIYVRRVKGFEERLSRVQQAAEVGKVLSHDSLLKILSCDRTGDGGLSVVSQFGPGISLRTLARTANERGTLLPAPVAVRIIIDAVHAASTLNKQLRGIRFDHSGFARSLFADTILVQSSGHTSLTDPVLSGQLASILVARGERELVVYRAPEELASSTPPSERAEIWTAGFLLWELLAGKRVCDSAHSDEALAALHAGQVPPLEQDRAISPSLARLIERAMSPNPERRPATLQELARLLQAFGPNVVAPCTDVQSAIAPYLAPEFEDYVDSDQISDVVVSFPQDWEPPTLMREEAPRLHDTMADGAAAAPLARSTSKRSWALVLACSALAMSLAAWLMLGRTTSAPASTPTSASAAPAITPAAAVAPPAGTVDDEPAEPPEAVPSARRRRKMGPAGQPEPFHPRGI
jgi:serine/threonine protein kinase